MVLRIVDDLPHRIDVVSHIYAEIFCPMRNTSGCVDYSLKASHLRPRLFKIKLHRFKRCFDAARMNRPDNIKAA